MSLLKINFTGKPGANFVRSSTLSFTDIIRVRRSGLYYKEVTGFPGNLEFRYGFGGKITFNVPFTGTAGMPQTLEPVEILYKIP